ncbi:beta-lactamase-like protein [Scheffersomyces xylosifermentans]|uniref:beta-lactamase-like protein n=1 Tax=Scheffersomyces xylosifermentans TaxID=1304137 RepID=UPI00315C9E6F
MGCISTSKPLATGNTFTGLIREFPGIGVDKFNTSARVFLLTHSHADHTVGLGNKAFAGRVYCTKMTKEIVALNNTFGHNLSFLIPKELNTPFRVTTEIGDEVTITLIPAYHSPGSCMFLAESESKAALITGDIRAESWWVESLTKNPYLFPYTTGLKQLDHMYIDTSFSYRGEPFVEIPPNNEGIRITIELLKAFPKDDPEIHFCFMDNTSGFEEAWAQIISSFNGSLHTSSDIRRRTEVIARGNEYEYGIVLQNLIGRVANGPVFHVRGRVDDNDILNSTKVVINIYQSINFNIIDFMGTCIPIDMSTIDMSQLTILETTKRGNKVVKFRDRAWILPHNGRELLPTDIRLLFSRHSSYSETVRLVTAFKPKSVYPCTDSQSTWLNGFTMERIFGEFCKPGQERYPYDLAMFKRYGRPSPIVMERPVITINRWNILDCEEELRFVGEYLTHWSSKGTQPKPEIKLFGQYQRSRFKEGNTDEAKDAYTSRAKDMKLENIIAGRGEHKFKKVIMRNQDLYLQKYSEDSLPSRYYDNYNQDEGSHTDSQSWDYFRGSPSTGSRFSSDIKVKKENESIKDFDNEASTIYDSTDECPSPEAKGSPMIKVEVIERNTSFSSMKSKSLVVFDRNLHEQFDNKCQRSTSQGSRSLRRVKSSVASFEISVKQSGNDWNEPLRKKPKMVSFSETNSMMPDLHSGRIDNLSTALNEDRSFWLGLNLSSTQT